MSVARVLEENVNKFLLSFLVSLNVFISIVILYSLYLWWLIRPVEDAVGCLSQWTSHLTLSQWQTPLQMFALPQDLVLIEVVRIPRLKSVGLG